MRPARVFVVDDMPDVRRVFAEFLAGAGLHVTEADGGHGVEQALLLVPDLIVLDFELDGEVVGLLRRAPTTRHIPIIALAEMEKLRETPASPGPAPGGQ